MSRALDVDLRCTPFSRRGSYFAVSGIDARATPGVFLRTVHGDVRQRELVGLVVGGDSHPAARVTPGQLDLTSGASTLSVALDGAGRAVLRLERGTAALDLQVSSQYDVVLQESAGVWRFIASGANRNYRIRVSGGSCRLVSGWDGVKDADARLALSAEDGPLTVTIDEFGSTAPAPAPTSFAEVAADAAADFEAWCARHSPAADDRTASASRLALFVMWGALVPAGGALRRESMLMSKNWMTNIWAWDHCFNAMALWRDPAAAADQLLTVFDHQDEHGALPDYVNDVGVEPNFVKPPIHGWAVEYLLDRGGLADAAVADLYSPLARWTDWWFDHRDFGGDGVPSYTHGNDSGWDNSTVFARGVPVQSPDLLAFLALQMRALARMADRLGLPEDAAGWRGRAVDTVDLLVARFWHDGRFVARSTATGDVIVSDSLLTLMPLALGDLLPAGLFASEVDRLVGGGYLTAHGIATEPVGSPHYVADGYWRGPIWAPTTMLLVDGLRRGGQRELADDVAQRFVDTCTASGMAENFDALTGAGLRDLSMTWTASVFLTLLDGIESAHPTLAPPLEAAV